MRARAASWSLLQLLLGSQSGSVRMPEVKKVERRWDRWELVRLVHWASEVCEREERISLERGIGSGQGPCGMSGEIDTQTTSSFRDFEDASR